MKITSSLNLCNNSRRFADHSTTLQYTNFMQAAIHPHRRLRKSIDNNKADKVDSNRLENIYSPCHTPTTWAAFAGIKANPDSKIYSFLPSQLLSCCQSVRKSLSINPIYYCWPGLHLDLINRNSLETIAIGGILWHAPLKPFPIRIKQSSFSPSHFICGRA